MVYAIISVLPLTTHRAPKLIPVGPGCNWIGGVWVLSCVDCTRVSRVGTHVSRVIDLSCFEGFSLVFPPSVK